MTEGNSKESVNTSLTKMIMAHADLEKVEQLMRAVHEVLGAFDKKGVRLGAIDVSYALTALMAEAAEDLGGNAEFQAMAMRGCGEIAAEMLESMYAMTEQATDDRDPPPVDETKDPPATDEGALAKVAEERRRKAEAKNTPERGTQTGRLPPKRPTVGKGFVERADPSAYVMNIEEFNDAVREGSLMDAEGEGFMVKIVEDDGKHVAMIDRSRPVSVKDWKGKRVNTKGGNAVVWFNK